jgi:hypothetical protein
MPREKIATWPSAQASRITVRPVEAISGNRTITLAELEQYQALIFNPSTTSRDVVLPPEAACQGVMVMIGNTGTTTGTLVVKNSAGTQIAVVGSVAGATDVSNGWFVCDGTAWYGGLGA